MSTATKEEAAKERLSINIEGMHCASCVATIEKALSKKDGVISVSVSLLDEKAVVEYERSRVDRMALEQAVESVGYRAKRASITMTLNPHPDEAKMGELSKKLKQTQGVIDVRSYLTSGRILVEYDEDLVMPKTLQRAVKNFGYEVDLGSAARTDRESLAREKEIRYYSTLLAMAVILTVPIMLIMFGVLTPLLPAGLSPEVPMFFLTTPVQFISGYPFYKSSFRGLRHGKTNMDTLIMLGTSAAYFYSVAATFFLQGYVAFYDTAAMLITFILLGRTLEAIAKGRTSRAIRGLMSLQAQVAVVERNGQEMTIPAEDVEVGDIVLVKPSDKVAVDGEVIDGQSTVDESMITGESMPVSKKTGQSVVGGTLNKAGVLRVRATKVGEDSVLSQIVKLVEEAQTQKPAIQRKADAIAEIFVPIVLVLAAATFIIWGVVINAPWDRALSFTIAVLVAACPCALGLATPTAIMVGIGRGAKQGILFKTGAGLEVIPNVDTIVFDKTGTLTIGRPTVTDVVPASGVAVEEAIRIAASVEKNSEHPLAEAVVHHAEDNGIELEKVQEFVSESGMGVRAKMDGSTVLVGSDRYMVENSIDLGEICVHQGDLQDQGKTVVYVAKDGHALAMLGIADAAKPTSAQAIQTLKDLGLDVWMITGDKEKTARAIANKMGIDNFMAEVLPADKANRVKALQDEGRVVAMTGDGVNDAPALAQADVGIALGSGTDVAVETGDIILVKNDLLDVVSAIELGRKTMSKIKQGFFWAMIYNLALVPVAAGLLLPFTGLVLRPEYAGLAMSLSSVSVVTNALLLGRFKPRVVQAMTESLPEPSAVRSGIAIDPVCMMDVDTATSKLYSEYKGRRYYFCATHCKTVFDENPTTYENQDVRV